MRRNDRVPHDTSAPSTSHHDGILPSRCCGTGLTGTAATLDCLRTAAGRKNTGQKLPGPDCFQTGFTDLLQTACRLERQCRRNSATETNENSLLRFASNSPLKNGLRREGAACCRAPRSGSEGKSRRFVELPRRRSAGNRPARSRSSFFNGLLRRDMVDRACSDIVPGRSGIRELKEHGVLW